MKGIERGLISLYKRKDINVGHYYILSLMVNCKDGERPGIILQTMPNQWRGNFSNVPYVWVHSRLISLCVFKISRQFFRTGCIMEIFLPSHMAISNIETPVQNTEYYCEMFGGSFFCMGSVWLIMSAANRSSIHSRLPHFTTLHVLLLTVKWWREH